MGSRHYSFPEANSPSPWRNGHRHGQREQQTKRIASCYCQVSCQAAGGRVWWRRWRGARPDQQESFRHLLLLASPHQVEASGLRPEKMPGLDVYVCGGRRARRSMQTRWRCRATSRESSIQTDAVELRARRASAGASAVMDGDKVRDGVFEEREHLGSEQRSGVFPKVGAPYL